MRHPKVLADGTPYWIQRHKRCAECGQWITDKTSMHGPAFGPYCTCQRTKGRARVTVDVARKLTRPNPDGSPRWDRYQWDAASPVQRREALALG